MIMLSNVQLDRPVTSSGLTQAEDDDDNDYLRSYVKMSKIKKLTNSSIRLNICMRRVQHYLGAK